MQMMIVFIFLCGARPSRKHAHQVVFPHVQVPVQDAAVAIPQDLVMDESIHELVTRLISLVYQHGDERTKVFDACT